MTSSSNPGDEAKPSPWLENSIVPTHTAKNASFVEYLRWMRVKSGKVD